MTSRIFRFLNAVNRHRRRKTVSPRFLTHTLTFKCNAKCVMCDSWRLPNDNDLTLGEITRIYADLPSMDAVRFTGGEPFLRRDITEIAAAAVENIRPAMLHVTSNGFATARIIDFCQKRGKSIPLHLLLSIDGVGEKHNRVRGNQKAWEMVMNTIAELAPRRRELNLRIGVNQTIADNEGIEHYHRLKMLLRPHGIQNQVVLAYKSSATYNAWHENDFGAGRGCEPLGDFDREELDDFLRQVIDDLPELPWMERTAKKYYLKGLRNRVINGLNNPNPSCVALNAHLRILPNGDIPTCQFNAGIIGNLRQDGFRQIWLGEKAVNQRRWVAKCPGCWAECEIIPSSIYTLDIMRTIPGPAIFHHGAESATLSHATPP